MLGPCLVYMPKKCCLLVVVAHVSLILFNRQKKSAFFLFNRKIWTAEIALSSPARIIVFVPTEPASCKESVKEKEEEKERIINIF